MKSQRWTQPERLRIKSAINKGKKNKKSRTRSERSNPYPGKVHLSVRHSVHLTRLKQRSMRRRSLLRMRKRRKKRKRKN